MMKDMVSKILTGIAMLDNATDEIIEAASQIVEFEAKISMVTQ